MARGSGGAALNHMDSEGRKSSRIAGCLGAQPPRMWASGGRSPLGCGGARGRQPSCLKKLQVILSRRPGSNRVEVHIEKGATHNQKITFRGMADEMPGRETGDVHFIVQEKDHDLFKRKGADLLLMKDISVNQALTGF